MSLFYPQVLLDKGRSLGRFPLPRDFPEDEWSSILSQIVECLGRVETQLDLIIRLNQRSILSHASTNCYLTLLEELQNHYEDFSIALGEPDQLKVL